MELYELIDAGKVRTMIGLYIPEPEYPNAIMSRFLAKCAYEFFLFIMSEKKYDLCVKELLGSKIDTLKDLREYARYGKVKIGNTTNVEYIQKETVLLIKERIFTMKYYMR